MSEFKEMVKLTEKLFYYLDTFEINSGRETAREILLDALKKDAVEQRMKSMRAGSRYAAAAKAYYDKHGTVGEF